MALLFDATRTYSISLSGSPTTSSPTVVLMQASTVGLVLAPTLLHLTLRIGRIIEYRPGSALSLSLSYARYDILYILLVYGGLTLPLM